MIRTLALLFLLLSSLVQSQEAYERNPVEKLNVDFEAFNEPMQFTITLPPSYNKMKDKRYFLIFDIHPRSQPYLSGLHDWLSHNGEWPWLESIIVTPSGYHKEFGALFEQTVENPNTPAMLDFLESGVLSAVDKKYRTNGFTIYSGFMSNGAIGLYALLNRPKMFDAYFISSPTISDNFLNITSDAKEKLPKLTDQMRFVSVVIGDHRYEAPHVKAVKELQEILSSSAPEKLKWDVKLNDEHYYMSRPVFTVLNGIEALFDDYHNDLPLDSPIVKKGVDAIITHYKQLSEEKYGFPISAERTLKALAASLIDSEVPRALTVYQKVVELYPDSTYAHSDLALAYQKTGQLTKAIERQKVAVTKSSAMIEWHQNKMKQRLKKLQEEANAHEAN